jgi:hypothetical protein
MDDSFLHKVLTKNFFLPQFTNVRNKLYCLSLVGLSILVLRLRVRLGAYPRVVTFAPVVVINAEPGSPSVYIATKSKQCFISGWAHSCNVVWPDFLHQAAQVVVDKVQEARLHAQAIRLIKCCSLKGFE